MANERMMRQFSVTLGAMRPALLCVATIAAGALVACGSSSSAGGGTAASAGKAGDPCNPATLNQGCYNGVRMQCTADTTSAVGGKWALIAACSATETCTEIADPSNAGKKVAQCKAAGTGGGDAIGGVDVSILGGDASGTDKDTGPAIGSCGDGFCNTGETAASCPADCATNNCGNGTCDAGETKASCPADCGTTTNKCRNGTCDAGETAKSCPADCGGTTTSCGDGTCDPGETTANCPADCPAAGTDPTACLQANCATEYNACGTDQKCVDLLTCLNKCTSASDTACINACASTAGQGAVTEYTNLGNCGTTNNCFAGGGTTPTCGDGTCGAGETKANCPADCGTTTATNVCDAGCDSANAVGATAQCYCDNQCNQYGDCCSADGTAKAKTCAGSTCASCNGGGPTAPVCGNGKCEAGETTASCPKDCPAVTPVCGNGTCDAGETTASCPGDCPVKTCTTYSDVQAIFQNNCNGCHGHQFGNGCSSASNYSSIAAYVSNGSMPQGKKLSAADKAKIAAWAAAKNACTTASCP